jgi:uncharacterized SAM-binding protein YcdF (DUF218 family)
MSTLYTAIKLLLMPPGIILVLLLIAFFLVRGTLGRMLLFVAWSVLLIMSLPMTSTMLLASRQAYEALPPEQLDKTGADAIVVLAAGIYSNPGEYGEPLVDMLTFQRLRYGAFLHRRTGLPIFVSGGGEPIPYAELMEKSLRDELNVPTAHVEDLSRNTWENASLLAPMLRAAGVRRPLLVTNGWHMARAVPAFKHHGFDVLPAPTGLVKPGPPPQEDEESQQSSIADWLPQASAFMVSYYALHEMIGSIVYDFRAFMTPPEPTPAEIEAVGADIEQPAAPSPL